MLNKGLLLASGNKEKLAGIWEITVGKSSSNYGYSNGSYGSVNKLDPSPFIQGTNDEHFMELTAIKQDPSSGSTKKVYMAFSDIHEPNSQETYVFVHVKKRADILSAQFIFELDYSSIRTRGDLFNYSDVGKTYRMYIGPLETPPSWL